MIVRLTLLEQNRTRRGPPRQANREWRSGFRSMSENQFADINLSAADVSLIGAPSGKTADPSCLDRTPAALGGQHARAAPRWRVSLLPLLRTHCSYRAGCGNWEIFFGRMSPVDLCWHRGSLSIVSASRVPMPFPRMERVKRSAVRTNGTVNDESAGGNAMTAARGGPCDLCTGWTIRLFRPATSSELAGERGRPGRRHGLASIRMVEKAPADRSIGDEASPTFAETAPAGSQIVDSRSPNDIWNEHESQGCFASFPSTVRGWNRLTGRFHSDKSEHADEVPAQPGSHTVASRTAPKDPSRDREVKTVRMNRPADDLATDDQGPSSSPAAASTRRAALHRLPTA